MSANVIAGPKKEADLVKLLICGSVDDGKSTLLGRLLIDSRLIATDTLKDLEKDSKKHGTNAGKLDPALLTDGLKAEREQGITIDVAYRYFKTDKRSFIVADAPGHEQYTRNMATGASVSDVAIILVNAQKGVLTQTRRHSTICSLLGIKHIIVVVNKMDLVNWDQPAFEQIKEDFSAFAARLEIRDLNFIPISALHGDNVVTKSTNMNWYGGGTFLHLLNTIHIASDRNLRDFRFPVQYVLRPDSTYRGYCGTVASGVIRPGDEITILPAGARSKVASLDSFDGPLSEAFASQAITITLEDEIDISRGNTLVHPKNLPRVDSRFEAMILWMNKKELKLNREYLIKHTTKTVPVHVEQVLYRLNIDSLHREKGRNLKLNEIGRCAVNCHEPLMFDPYSRNKETGSFILIDRITNETMAAGTILEHTSPKKTVSQKTAIGLQPENSLITAGDRQKLLKQTPVTVLITGFSGAGKSTVAFRLEKILFEQGYLSTVIDGENLRLGLNSDLGFSQEDRRENVRRAMETAKIINLSGLIAICSLIAPTEEIRTQAGEIVGKDRLLTVYLNTPLDVCEKRHKKGLYDRFNKWETHNIPGKTSVYEPPKKPDICLNTARLSADECAEKIIGLLKKADYLL